MVFRSQHILSFFSKTLIPCCYPYYEINEGEATNAKRIKGAMKNKRKESKVKCINEMYGNMQFYSNAHLVSLSSIAFLPVFPETHLGFYSLLSVFIGWMCYPTFDKISWHFLNPQRIVQPLSSINESLRLYQISGQDVTSRFALLGLISFTLLLSLQASPAFLIITGLLTRLMLESQFRAFTKHYSEMGFFSRKMEGNAP
jgi:hypothetical protein